MNIIRAAGELHPLHQRVSLAIGFFDGVHLGHQEIIRQTVENARQHDALALVVTFDRHPNTVVAPKRVPPLIYSLPQKLRAVEALRVEKVLLIHFDKQFSEQTGEEFIRGLARDAGSLQSICVGQNFLFGHKRGGNLDLLKRLGAELSFEVHGLPAVAFGGQPVSSTRIREAIQAGELEGASRMLGRAYSLAGEVIRGDGMGKELGFATANLDVRELALPPKGVYAVYARTDDKVRLAVLNIGIRPTLQNPNPQLQTETHLLDFTGDLYGQELELTFLEKLRDEKKFDSLAELRAQIGRDILAAQSRFGVANLTS